MVAVNQLASRLRRNVQREGAVRFVSNRIAAKYNRTFNARLCVWQRSADIPLPQFPDDVEVRRFSATDTVPKDLIDRLSEADLPSFESRMREEFADHGVMWVALFGGEVAGYQWSRRGDYVRNWHFDLTASDTLVFSTVTFPAFRGRSVAVALAANICRHEVRPGGHAYADCMVFNKPAIRFLEKTGFKKIAERKPLPDHPD
ncbi:GNAT family N-acetyltransferase [Stratiformator vulcanicus]|uniref:N-acetyltransferase domain-containing protein n=1 Tax=Stratiformator vulcanicus TaxID=2527980 RepID=A0A517R1G8_9PLAN|nr:GNAT family N-acetyltransferase [Stratiformator vulcanicus]QDT37701.1 hypothetical protein Pan189_20830 [Stratiformator vulcanicus]